MKEGDKVLVKNRNEEYFARGELVVTPRVRVRFDNGTEMWVRPKQVTPFPKTKEIYAQRNAGPTQCCTCKSAG